MLPVEVESHVNWYNCAETCFFLCSRGFFLRWTEEAHHLEQAQEEIRNMVLAWGKLALS